MLRCVIALSDVTGHCIMVDSLPALPQTLRACRDASETSPSSTGLRRSAERRCTCGIWSP